MTNCIFVAINIPIYQKINWKLWIKYLCHSLLLIINMQNAMDIKCPNILSLNTPRHVMGLHLQTLQDNQTHAWPACFQEFIRLIFYYKVIMHKFIVSTAWTYTAMHTLTCQSSIFKIRNVILYFLCHAFVQTWQVCNCMLYVYLIIVWHLIIMHPSMFCFFFLQKEISFRNTSMGVLKYVTNVLLLHCYSYVPVISLPIFLQHFSSFSAFLLLLYSVHKRQVKHNIKIII